MTERGETLLAPEFSTVVFGHRWHDFDLDQLVSYYFLSKANKVNALTTFAFSSSPTPDQLSDPATAVIEGVSENAKNHFTNGPNDEPAADSVYQRVQRGFSEQSKERMRLLREWFSASEQHQEPKNLPPSLRENLDQVPQLFFALKEYIATHPDYRELTLQDQQKKFIQHITRLLDFLLNNNETPYDFTILYKDILQYRETTKAHDHEKLESLAAQPDRVRHNQTMNGLTLGFFDIRGSGVAHGAMSLAREKTSADVVLLVDDEVDDLGKVVGTQIKLSLTQNRKESNGLGDVNLHELLSERLNSSERLFGKGFTLTTLSEFGGHIGIVGSPRLEGSAVPTDELWTALLRFFDVPRFTKEAFTKEASQLAKRSGVTQYEVFLLPSTHASELAEWVVRLTVPGEKGPLSVDIAEKDLTTYQRLLTDDEKANQRLLAQTTIVSEPNEVVNAKTIAATEYLNTCVSEHDALGILRSLDQLNTQTVRSLPLPTRLGLIQSLAQSPQAIKQVYDQSDETYRITTSLPNWILADLDAYKQARYRYESVPHKVDFILIPATVHEVLQHSNPEEQRQLSESLSSLARSPVYQETHKSTSSYDQLLETIHRFSTDPQCDPQVHTMLSEVLGAFAPVATPEVNTRLALSSYSYVILPNPDAILGHVGENPRETVLTVLVEIGRPILDQVKTTTPVDALIHVDGTLLLDAEHQEHRIIATAIIEQLKNLHRLSPDSPLRVVRGGFPMPLVDALTIALYTDPDQQLATELRKQLRFTNYNQQEQAYVDTFPFQTGKAP